MIRVSPVRCLAPYGRTIHAIDSDMNSVAFEIKRKYVPRFEATIITGVGHWPHLEASERFNATLKRVLESLQH